jgi:hypothetical protein
MRIRSLLLCLLIVCVAFAPTGFVFASPDPLLVATIVRSGQVKTLRVRFRITEEWRQGAASGFKNRGAGLGPLPDKDMRFEAENTFLLDGKKFRYESHPVVLAWSNLKQNHRIAAANNGLLTQLYLGEKGGGRNLGSVEEGRELGAVGQPEIQPLLFFCRANDATLCRHPPLHFRWADGRAVIAGVSCKELLVDEDDRSTHFWMDRDNDYCVRQIQVRRKGKVVLQTEIDYKPNAVTSLFPSAWRSTRFHDGRVLNVTTVEVVDVELNRPIAPACFDLQFPSNTHWVDNRTRKHFVINAEGHETEEQQPGEGPPSRPEPPSRPTNWWVLSALGVVALLLLVAAWFRRKSQPPATEGRQAVPS